mmetsp:Transcript_18897/g.39832  ORF Transcript_18897/g.39832 Transcript_18897/m.39832 type:complete len:128 (-) Transcript_18897:224-607(-)
MMRSVLLSISVNLPDHVHLQHRRSKRLLHNRLLLHLLLLCDNVLWRSLCPFQIMIRTPGIDNGAFVVWPGTVWYARVLLLFSASATTDTGSKSFDCALVTGLCRRGNVRRSCEWMVKIDWFSDCIRA